MCVRLLRTTRYMQFDVDEAAKLVPEGVEGRVPYRGALAGSVHQLMGGLRSGMGYCGCGTLEALRTKSTFVKISSAGLKESHPPNTAILHDAPNHTTHR